MAWIPLAATVASSLLQRGGRNRGGGGGGGGDMPNPQQAAQPYFQQIPQMQRQYLAPYYESGGMHAGNANTDFQSILNLYNNTPDLYANEMPEYGQMRRNPQEFVNNIMRGYTPSEGYRFKENRMLNSMRNSAAAGGFAGSDFHQQGAADTVRGLLGEDMQEYFRNIMGTQQMGLGAEERRLTGRERTQENRLAGLEGAYRNRAGAHTDRERLAFDAAQALANGGTSTLTTLGGLGYQGAVDAGRQRIADLNRRQEESRGRRDLLSTAMGTMASMYSGGMGGGGGGFGGSGGGGWFGR